MSRGAIIALVVGILILFGGATIKAIFGRPPHDPDNFTLNEANWYSAAFMASKCKEIKCKIGKGKGTP